MPFLDRGYRLGQRVGIRCPENCVYVGRRSFHHRLQVTKWQSPWTPGHNCDTADWLALYSMFARLTWLQLAELKGMQDFGL